MAPPADTSGRILPTLTIVTVIFVPVTFTVGIDGMNLELMPQPGFHPAYFAFSGAVLLTVATIARLFCYRG